MRKNKRGKKVAKRNVKKSARKTVKHEIVVRVAPVVSLPTETEVGAPLVNGGKYMIPRTWMSERQVLRLVQKTPRQYVYSRPAKGGGRWSYVTGSYIEKVLNYTFGWAWDFEITKEEEKHGQVIVLGRLTVKDDKGHSIVKMQAGRADIKFKRDSKVPLDYGNDVKAAATDALKKCASLLGIASDIYGNTEYKEETGTAPQPDHSAPAPDDKAAMHYEKNDTGQIVDHICSWPKCGRDITKQEADYSTKLYGRPLCRQHQDSARFNSSKK